jgi:hypothetical protein
MNLSVIPSAFDCLRKGEAVADAVKHRNATDLGKFVGLLIVAVVQLVQGTSYAQYVSFVTPEMATSIGLFVAGACVAWGRWATSPDNGVLPARPVDAAPVAGPDRNGTAVGVEPPAAPVASQPADAGAPDPVRADGDPAQAPGGYLRG